MQKKRRILVAAMALTPLAACQSVLPTQAMPGCLSYVIADDSADSDALWITEVWDSATSHKASLSLPEVQAALQAGRPMIAGFGERFETHPVGGFGTRFSAAH